MTSQAFRTLNPSSARIMRVRHGSHFHPTHTHCKYTDKAHLPTPKCYNEKDAHKDTRWFITFLNWSIDSFTWYLRAMITPA